MALGPGAIEGSCHCGAVQIRVAVLPDHLNDCQCEHCQKRGALWGYYSLDQFDVTGPTSVYVWGDRQIEFHFCATCGMTTHWWPIDPVRHPRMGLNARTLGKAVFQQIPTRKGGVY